MARESKRRREERRFGKPERLIDILQDIPWLTNPDPFYGVDPDLFLAVARKATVLAADNVFRYVRSQPDKEWSWTDLPPVRLPFPSVFVESSIPGPISQAFPRVGVLLAENTAASGIEAAEHFVQWSRDFPDATRIGSDIDLIRERCAMSVDYGFVVLMRAAIGIRAVHFCRGVLFLDSSGIPLRSPVGQFDPHILPDPARDAPRLRSLFWGLFFPSVLAIAFANCKNVTLTAVDPPSEISRERKKAGLRSFVRYHTINIEPMKQVLRTEGGIEAHGLKRALHICRGHFATYKDRFMGRPLNTPLTVWRPSHVRGSLESGVVVSDYRVNPPRAGEGAKP